jgi:hypothetical protein
MFRMWSAMEDTHAGATMHEVELRRRSVGALSSVLPSAQAERFEAAAQQVGRLLRGQTVGNVSSVPPAPRSRLSLLAGVSPCGLPPARGRR